MQNVYLTLGRAIAWYLFWRFNAVSIGEENIPKSGPLLFAGDHQQVFDGLLSRYGTRSRKVVRTMIKLDGEHPLALYLLDKLADMFTIKRNISDLEAMRMAISVLKNGDAICMFPEGHRSKEVIGFHPGVAMIARRVPSAQIVPFGISNAEHLTVRKVIRNLDRGLPGKRPTIRFGPPFRLPPTYLPTKQQREVDIDRIRREVLALLPPELEGKNELWVVNGD